MAQSTDIPLSSTGPRPSTWSSRAHFPGSCASTKIWRSSKPIRSRWALKKLTPNFCVATVYLSTVPLFGWTTQLYPNRPERKLFSMNLNLKNLLLNLKIFSMNITNLFLRLINNLICWTWIKYLSTIYRTGNSKTLMSSKYKIYIWESSYRISRIIGNNT
jgi:hypothetical protein